MLTNGSGFPTRRAWLIALSVLVGGAFIAACSDSSTPTAEPMAQTLYIDSDTVLGPANLTEEEMATKICVQTNRFAQNEEIVWRVKVYDPQTGEAMDDTALETLKVQLPDQTLDLHYGGHPGSAPVDFFWTVSWDVPEGYPTGTVDYKIVATAKDGRTGEWDQFKVAYAMLTVTDDVRPIIEPAE